MVGTLCFPAQGPGSIPSLGTKILQVVWSKKKKNEDEIYTNIEILCCIFETNIRLYVICTSIYLFIFSVHQFKKEPLQRKNEGYW